MFSFQKDRLWEKVRAIRTKDPGYVFRGVKIFLSPRTQAIDVYWLDLPTDFASLDKQIDEKMPASLKSSLSVEVLSQQNQSYLENYLALRPDEFLTRELVTRILADGGLVFLAVKDGQIVAANTLIFNKYRLRGGFDLDFVLQEGQVYSCHTYVVPALRSHRLSLFLKRYTFSYCTDRGYRAIISAIYPFNKPSLKSAACGGYQKYATIILIEQFLTKWHQFLPALANKKKQIKVSLFGKEEVFI